MDANLDKVALDLYGKIQNRFPDIKIGDENGKVLSKEEDIPQARFFEFEYEEGGEPLGSIAISLDSKKGLVMQISGDLVDDDNSTKHSAFQFIRSFRKFAKGRMLKFKVENMGKSELDKRDYEFKSKRKEEPMAQIPVMESKFYGTNKISYQDLGEARLVIKHNQAVDPELPTGRTMHIDSIYIENAVGERFKYPAKHINGARALAEHIKAGGNPYDGIGKHIIGLSEELAQLRKFKNYVGRQEQLSEAMGDITSKVMERIEQIKKEIHCLQRPTYYQEFAESFAEKEERAIPETIMNDWIDRLTIRTFNEELKSVFPYIYNLVDESDIPIKELSANDLLDEKAPEGWEGTVKGMKKHKEIDNPFALAHWMKNKGYKSHKKENIDPEVAFENFIEDLVNENKDEIFSPNKDAQRVAIEKLNKIMGAELKAGPDAVNAVGSLKGLIDDPEFLLSLKDIDGDLDIRPLIQQYILQRDPEVAAQLEIGEPGEQEAPPATPATPAVPAVPAAAAQPQAAPVAENQNYTADEMVAILSGQKTQAQVDAERKNKPQPTNKPTTTTTPAKKESNNDIPFDGPYKKVGDVTDKSGATHSGHSRSRHLARQGLLKAIQSAKKAGATLDTKLDFGHKEMTLHDAIIECGMTPMECGFEEPRASSVDQMLKSIAGFWNKEERNFTIGGTRAKTKVIKAFKNGEYPDASEDDVRQVIALIDKMDPSGNPMDLERHRLLKLAGVSHGDMEEQVPNFDPAAQNLRLRLPKFSDDDKDDDVIDLNKPDQIGQILQRKITGALNKAQGQVPNQNVQFPGGQINPADFMKHILQQMNTGK